MRTLKIAHVTSLQESVPPKGKNGLEQIVYDLTEELVHRGHEVTLFGTADSRISGTVVPIVPLAVSRDRNAKLRSYHYSIFAISEAFLHQNEFDLIHTHERFTSVNFAGLVKIPVVSTIHHPISYEQKYLDAVGEIYEKHSLSLHTVVVSRFQQQQFPLPSTVIHNGIDLKKWDTFSTNPGEYFAYLGYLTPNKGAAQAIQAILQTNEKLVIAGDIRDDDEQGKHYFKEQIEPYVDGEKIKFVGVLDQKEKKEFFRNAKATLMPIQWDEPFGLVAIESMASGTPVIAWNRAAMPEIVEEGVSGYLINSVEEMVKRIGDVDSLDRQSCRTQVEEHFSVEKMTQEYENLYRKLVG